MRILFAGWLVIGSVGATTAAETYADYRDYFGSKFAPVHRVDRKRLRNTIPQTHTIDTRRYDDYIEDSVSKNSDNLRPGYRVPARTYMPGYNTHPSSLAGDGFGGSASQSYGGSVGTPRRERWRQ